MVYQLTGVQIDEELHIASHVELSFKDEYLARADMWRLAVSELSLKSVYKGQALLFINSIKATVKNIYVKGKRVGSAYFSPTTRPIFRSESARYVIFIQMSREMWDFDTEGSGEIMFNKVVNGFLPDLFKRWETMKVRHLVSIILFSRMEYDKGVLVNPKESSSRHSKTPLDSASKDFRDYYRVVVTEYASTEWVKILNTLKKEQTEDAYVIAGQLTTAAKGNILEAINLASSQFSKDYIDRDLVRTGISVVIITAGTGVFEVDYNMLKLTTDTLVGNGIGIDLVALGGMPLHSVPLFRYRTPRVADGSSAGSAYGSLGLASTPRQHNHLPSSFVPDTLRATYDSHRSSLWSYGNNQWSYALPHWIDVSFWTGYADHGITRAQLRGRNGKGQQGSRRNGEFVASCRMYELQMMGLMENEMSDVCIPFMHEASQLGRIGPDQRSGWLNLKDTDALGDASVSTSFNSNYGIGLIGDSPVKSYGNSARPLDGATVNSLNWMKQYDQETFGEIADAPSNTAPANKSSVPDEATPDTYETPSTHTVTHKPSMGISPGTSQAVGRLPAPMLRAQNYSRNQGSPQNYIIRISFGLWGLGPTKGTASIKVDAGNAETKPAVKADTLQDSGIGAIKPSSKLTDLLHSLQRKPSQATISQVTVSSKGTETSVASDPIAIKSHSADAKGRAEGSDADTLQQSPRTLVNDGTGSDFGTVRRYPRSSGQPANIILKDASTIGRRTVPLTEAAASADPQGLQRTLSPLNAMNPWLTLLNPSNPRKDNMSIASQFRRWHHVFPKAIPTSAIKWKSLCSPAALPLTNEYFPTSEQIRTEYYENPYRLRPSERDDLSEEPHPREALLRELIAYRLSHGFQVVVGSAVDEFLGSSAASLVRVFEHGFVAEDGATIFLSVGNAIHQILCVGDDEIQVTRFNRKPMAAVASTGLVDPALPYNPYVRTAFATGYEKRQFDFKPTRTEYDWNTIDHFLAGYQDDLSKDIPYWRARFVLIPVEPPKGSRRPLTVVAEDTDEEMRLEGIQRLTQTWQRHRYTTAEERRYQMSLQNQRKDPNPLAIEYETNDPATVARAFASGHADTLLQRDASVQLFAEDEQYHSNDFDIRDLAQDMQADPPKGVKVMDRRWHLRLHYKCFRGDEFTSWLLGRFKDIHSREEAEQLGKVLRKKGLFSHVQQKHDFRDGHYFYQIASEYRTTPHPDNRASWWSRVSDKSIPSTPMGEGGPKGSPVLERSHSRQTDGSVDISGEKTPTRPGHNRPKLELTHMLRYNVDRHGSSDRPEIINLHYDRLHNPENCYHIRIDWMNVTAKLIEDAVVQWATQVERYGLKLVEVPIAEASTITTQHPFRAPYRVKLALSPPSTRPQNYFDPTSFTPQPSDEKFPYQKALLRKCDFVLDMEAAEAFEQSGADVTYSYGRPDFRYTQFIHKSGLVLTQVDSEGQFLIVKNALCSNRAASAKDSIKFDRMERQDRRFLGNTPGFLSRQSSPLCEL
ncbi:vacuolar membrane-associated protein iml1 [Taxawa tesnikishii (nom. ined.)]|nr:vacuolar membrane-associated protein iml1 [Dothideales sp. JES 119]